MAIRPLPPVVVLSSGQDDTESMERLLCGVEQQEQLGILSPVTTKREHSGDTGHEISDCRHRICV